MRRTVVGKPMSTTGDVLRVLSYGWRITLPRGRLARPLRGKCGDACRSRDNWRLGPRCHLIGCFRWVPDHVTRRINGRPCWLPPHGGHCSQWSSRMLLKLFGCLSLRCPRTTPGACGRKPCVSSHPPSQDGRDKALKGNPLKYFDTVISFLDLSLP